LQRMCCRSVKNAGHPSFGQMMALPSVVILNAAHTANAKVRSLICKNLLNVQMPKRETEITTKYWWCAINVLWEM